MKRWISSIPLLSCAGGQLGQRCRKEGIGLAITRCCTGKTGGAWDWEHAQVGPLDASRASTCKLPPKSITPAGKSTVFLRQADGPRARSAQKLVAVQHSHGLMLLDVTNGAIIQNLADPEFGASAQ